MPTDRLKKDIGVGREGVVAESQNGVARKAKAFVSRDVFSFPEVVNAAVEFDNQSKLGAEKVDDEAGDWRLPAKLQVSEPPTLQHFPEDALRSRHV